LKVDGIKLKFAPVKGASPAAAKTGEFPYLMKIGKSRHYWHKNNLMTKTFAPKREYDALLLQYPDGYIEVSKEDAKKIGIRDGWAIKVNSPYGSTRAVVMTSDNIKSDTAYVELFNIDNLKALVSKQADLLKRDEDTIIPIRIEKI
jgi:formate dehydrogenase major subunit